MPIIGTIASSRPKGVTPTYFLWNQSSTTLGAYAGALDSDRNIYQVGQKDVSGFYRNAILKLSPEGTTLAYKGELITGENSFFGAVAVDSANRIVCVGSTGGTSRAIISSYNQALSSANWRGAYTSGNTNKFSFNAVTTDSSNNVYAAGIVQSSSNAPIAYMFWKWNSSGSVLWAKQATISSLTSAAVSSIALDSSNNVYVLGSMTQAGNSGPVYFKFNSNGVEQQFFWDRANSGGNGYDMKIVDNVIYSTYFVSSYWQLNKYSTSFALQSRPDARTYGSTAALQLNLDPDGNVYVGGWAYPTDRYIGFVTKYNSAFNITLERSFRPTFSSIDFIALSNSLLYDQPSNSLVQLHQVQRGSLAISGGAIMRIPVDGSKTQTIPFGANSTDLGSINYTTGLSALTTTFSYSTSNPNFNIADLSYSTTSYSYSLGDISVTNGATIYT